MTVQQQPIAAEGSLHSEHDEHQEPIPQKGPQRRATLAQLRLAQFISERDVAEFRDVVHAMENRDYKQVDVWKAEAQRKGPPVILMAFPKFTLKLPKRETDPTSLMPTTTSPPSGTDK